MLKIIVPYSAVVVVDLQNSEILVSKKAEIDIH